VARRVLKLLVLVCAAFIAVAAVWLYRQAQFTKQVRTLVIGRDHVRELEALHRRDGQFPQQLPSPERVDGWGRRYGYSSDGQSFVLVGFGRDGRREASVIPSGKSPPTSICGSWDSDTVLTDLQEVQICGK
jgi:hypothetical protein